MYEQDSDGEEEMGPIEPNVKLEQGKKKYNLTKLMIFNIITKHLTLLYTKL